MDHLIPITCKLQDVLNALTGPENKINLPQIVVIGSQSSGKSSVLEGIVGRSFLPRGQGIVTRRPLILQLVPLTKSIECEENSKKRLNDEWGQFSHLPENRFRDFDAIRAEIIDETNRLITGSNLTIHPKPIKLTIFSPYVLALTLIDLPGMTKVAMHDQPHDIEQQIIELSHQYSSNPNAIIVAVTPATMDIATSDAIQLARKVDPLGLRTIGVLTKVDLMDPGTDVVEILTNKLIPLKRGYIAVVNRGQKNVQKKISVREGLRLEENFFQKSNCYNDPEVKALCGIKNLSRILNKMLLEHLQQNLPELKAKIVAMTAQNQVELDSIGCTADLNIPTKTSFGATLLGLIGKFVVNFHNAIDGAGTQLAYIGMTKPSLDNKSLHADNELFGGARIFCIFHNVFAESLLTVSPFDSLDDDEIRTTIRNVNGTRPSLFVPEMSFDILVRRQISRLEQPGIQCVDLIYKDLQRIAAQCEPMELSRYPNLREKIIEVVQTLLTRSVEPTRLMVSNLIKIELAYINTSHPDFIGGSKAVANIIGKEKSNAIKQSSRAIDNINMSQAENKIVYNSPTPSSNPSYYIGTTPVNEEISLLESKNKLCANDVNIVSQDAPSVIDQTGGIMKIFFGGSKQTPGREKELQNSKLADDTSRISSPKYTTPSYIPAVPNIVQLPQVPHFMFAADAPPTDRERIEMEIIKSLIESYFTIVRKNIIDMVPKTIMYFLVNHVRDHLHNELVAELYRENEFIILMKEAEDITERRMTCLEIRDLLFKALEIVNEVRDFTV